MELRADFPKIIHFIWMDDGPPLPDMYIKSYNRWKELNPYYSFMYWDSAPKCMPKVLKDLVEKLPYYCQKSDIIRYWLIYKYGGMYFDFDQFPYRGIDELRQYSAFTALQYSGHVACACLGAVPQSPQYSTIVDYCIKMASEKHLVINRCTFGPSLLSDGNIRRSFTLKGAIVAPSSWFYILPPKQRRECQLFAESGVDQKARWIHDRQHLCLDKVVPYTVNLWGHNGSSFAKEPEK